MPNKSPNVPVSGFKSTGKDQGKIIVMYRDVRGRLRDAKVLGLATDAVAGHLKLLVDAGPSRRIVDNVVLSTAKNSTNVYFYRHQ